VLSKKPANIMLHDALRTLASFNLITKNLGEWEAAETTIHILPSILFVISNEQISSIANIMDEEKNKSAEETEVGL